MKASLVFLLVCLTLAACSDLFSTKTAEPREEADPYEGFRIELIDEPGQILFTVAGPPVRGRQVRTLYSMDPDGGNIRQLTDGTVSVSGAFWSPDGRYVALYGEEMTNQTGAQEYGATIFLYDVEAGRTRLLRCQGRGDLFHCPSMATSSMTGIQWSADSKKIFFRAMTAPIGGDFDLFSYSLEDSVETNLTGKFGLYEDSFTAAEDGSIYAAVVTDWNKGTWQIIEYYHDREQYRLGQYVTSNTDMNFRHPIYRHGSVLTTVTYRDVACEAIGIGYRHVIMDIKNGKVHLDSLGIAPMAASIHQDKLLLSITRNHRGHCQGIRDDELSAGMGMLDLNSGQFTLITPPQFDVTGVYGSIIAHSWNPDAK